MEGWNQIEASSLIWIQENIRGEFLDKLMVFLSAINNSGMIAIATVIFFCFGENTAMWEWLRLRPC